MVASDRVGEEVSGIVVCIRSRCLLYGGILLVCGGIRFVMAFALQWCWFHDDVRLVEAFVVVGGGCGAITSTLPLASGEVDDKKGKPPA